MKHLIDIVTEHEFEEFIQYPVYVYAIQEHNLSNELERTWKFIDEHNGVFDGELNFSKEITKTMWSLNKECIKINVSDERFFIRSIIISYSENHSTSYLPKYSKLVDGKFDCITILIDKKENNTFKLFIKSFLHEITHAYEDYNRRIKGYKLLEDILLGDKSSYKLSRIIPINKLIRNIDYFCTKSEQNSFLTELSIVLDNVDFISFEDAVQLFFNSDVWKLYKKICLDFRQCDKKILTNDWNKIHNSQWSTNKINNHITSNLNKFSKKFGRLICKIYDEHVEKLSEDGIKESFNLCDLSEEQFNEELKNFKPKYEYEEKTQNVF